MQSARQDIKVVESWGYSPGEALEFVTRRAVAEARRMAEQAKVTPDREALADQLAYLAELKDICEAAMRDRRFARGA